MAQEICPEDLDEMQAHYVTVRSQEDILRLRDFLPDQHLRDADLSQGSDSQGEIWTQHFFSENPLSPEQCQSIRELLNLLDARFNRH